MNKEQRDKESDEAAKRVRSFISTSLRGKGNVERMNFIYKIDTPFLEELYKIAIENEDYEVCGIIKKVLDERKE